MARFSVRNLGILDRLYQFAAGSPTAPIELELEGSIQPVHDVSRQSELGAITTDFRAGGFFQLGIDNIHPGADLANQTIDVYGSLDSSWGSPNTRWVWLMYAHLTANVAAAKGNLQVLVPQLGNATAPRQFMIRDWGATVVGSAGIAPANFANHGTTITNMERMPFPILPGGEMYFHSESPSACTIRVQTLCWIGPIGVYPPGLM